MFPNQDQRQSWGPASDFYGNYPSSSTVASYMASNGGPSWYNSSQTDRLQQQNSCQYMGTSDTGARGYQGGGSYLMSNQEKSIKAETSDAVFKNTNSSQPKLGINSNVYKMCSSIYQNSQTKQLSAQNTANRFNMRPDVTISEVTSLPRYSTETFPNDCLENDKSIQKLVSSPKQDLPTSSLSLQKPANLRQVMMQQKLEAEPTSSGSEHTLIVEPDSSTDLSGDDTKKQDYTDKKQKEQNSSQDTNPSIDTNMPFQDAIETEDFFGNNETDDDEDDDEDDDDEDDLDDDDLLESSDEGEAGNFVQVKMERESVDAKFMPNFFKRESGAALPLQVELQEYDSIPHPPPLTRHMPMAFFNNSMMTKSSKPNKRGRKPKHYNDILFELGQRGISITRANPLENMPAMGKQPLLTGPKVGTGQQHNCPHCNKVLTTSVGLMYHIRLHTGEKPYSCDLCGKSFATSSHYHYHMRSHSGQKPYRCDFCGKMYTASGSLRLHLKSHLSQLAADARNGIQQQLMMMPQDPLMVAENDLLKNELLKIKQETTFDCDGAPNQF